jgi:hypothetical protein
VSLISSKSVSLGELMMKEARNSYTAMNFEVELRFKPSMRGWQEQEIVRPREGRARGGLTFASVDV